jgi:DNA-directed RNA polymerase specialized sigma24 family protein
MVVTFRQRAAAHFTRWPRSLSEGRLLGLDLSGPGVQCATMIEDVTKLVMARWSASAAAQKLDPQELLHTVVVSILKRNQGHHPYDPRRASVSTWVSLVANGVICNALAAQRGRVRREAASDPELETAEPAPLRPAVGHQEDTWELEAELDAEPPPAPLWRRALDERERLGQLDLEGRVAAPPVEPIAAAPRASAPRRPVEADPRQRCLF